MYTQGLVIITAMSNEVISESACHENGLLPQQTII